MRRVLALFVVPLSLAAFEYELLPTQPTAGGNARQGPTPQAEPYEVSATVLEDKSHGPMICFVIRTSLPPQCGNVAISNWHWRAVEGEERLSGTIWGAYHVFGRYDGERFTITDVSPFEEESVPAEPGYGDVEGPCCHEVPTARELSRVRRQVEAGLDELDLQMIWSSNPDSEPVIQIGVVVRLYPALRPVDARLSPIPTGRPRRHSTPATAVA